MNLTVRSKERIIEKFVFEIRSVLSQLNVSLNDIYLTESSCTLADIEQHLRACLLKLNAFQFTHRPENFSFYLSVETLEGGCPLNNMVIILIYIYIYIKALSDKIFLGLGTF